MMFGDWAATPPEAHYYTLVAGDHAASATLAAAAHQMLADAMTTEGAVMAANTAGTAAAGWQGVGGTAMLASSAEYQVGIDLLTAWLQAASAAAATIVEAYNTAEANMVPGPVCDTNRATQAGLVATNIGQNTPAIIALDTEYFGEHWPHNAAVMAAYQTAVVGMLDTLAVPPPLAPMTGNPAGPLAGVAQAAAQGGTNAAMHAGLQSMNETAGAVQPTEQAAAAPTAGASQAMSSMGPMLGQFGQFASMAGQLPQMAGQLPQMLGQLPQMATGLLGPLTSGMSSMGGAGAAGTEPVTSAALSQASLTPSGGLGAAGGGGGGGGFGAGGPGVVSSFTRPTSSFNAPNQPKLPAGWTASGEPPPAMASGTQPAAGGGGGGLYGAPAAMAGRDGAGAGDKAPARTMQLTGRPAANRGSDREN